MERSLKLTILYPRGVKAMTALVLASAMASGTRLSLIYCLVAGRQSNVTLSTLFIPLRTAASIILKL